MRKRDQKKIQTDKICNYIMHKILCPDLWLQRYGPILSILASALRKEIVLAQPNIEYEKSKQFTHNT